MQAVDGDALRVSAIARVSEPNVTFERDELQRKLDMREIDMKRKEKEVHHNSMEILRLQKENKLAAAEIQNLRDRNETLQQSLMNSRLLSQNARNDAENVLNESRIRELESALSAAIHKIKKGETELETWTEKWKILDEKYTKSVDELETIQRNKNEHKSELEMAFAKVKTAQMLIAKHESENDKMRNRIADLDNDCLQLRDTVESKDTTIDNIKRELLESKTDVAKLKSVLSVRSETNGVLRAQLEEINGNTFVITKQEMDKYKRLEKDYNSQIIKIKDLERSVMLQMDISTKSENELITLRETNEKNEKIVSKLNIELMETRKRVGHTGDREKILKREVIKLRKEKSVLADELIELKADPYSHDDEIKRIREGLAATSKAKQDEFEEKIKEARKRKLAEEGLNALRSRIGFLLEQQEQSSILASQWQEQKTVFKSEIEALHEINNQLRSRLANIQGQFVKKHIPKVVDDVERAENGGREAFGETKEDFEKYRNATTAGDVLSGKSTKGVHSLGGAFHQDAANAFPNTVEAFVERALFDSVCAFSSGTRQQPTTFRSGGTDNTGFKMSKPSLNANKKPVFKVTSKGKDTDKIEITLTNVVTAKGKENEEAAASELLVGTQMNAFLNFCQSRSPERVIPLYAEKVCALLNFVFNYVQDLTDQAGSARLDLSQVSSRVGVMDNRIQNLRLKYSVERTAKQKNALKYIREQMRMSDLRILLDDLNTKAVDQREEMEMSGVAFLDSNRSIVSMLSEVEGVTKELTLAGATSGTTTGGVGALEIRLPESEIDDETLYSLISLLAGGLEEAKREDDDIQLQNLDTTNNDNDANANMNQTTSTMMHSKVLSKFIRSHTKDYLSRIVMLNLKGNRLTNISCKTIAKFLENTPSIRMLDLRENHIDDDGAKILFEAVKRNKTIMYVTQRQNGFMIEGHREIQTNGKKTAAEQNSTRAEMDRLLDAPKFPLRVDIRYNEINYDKMDDMFEQVDYSVFVSQMQQKPQMQTTEAEMKNNGHGGFGNSTPVGRYGSTPASPGHPYAYSDSPRGTRPNLNNGNGKYSDATLTNSPYMDSHSRGNSVQAAKMNASRVSWTPNGATASVNAELNNENNKGSKKDSHLSSLNDNVKNGTFGYSSNTSHIPRPQSASVAVGSGSRVAIGARSMQEWKDDSDNDNGSTKRGGGEDHGTLIDLLETNANNRSDADAGSLVDSQLRGNNAGIGNMLDNEIRNMVSTGNDKDGHVESGHGHGHGNGNALPNARSKANNKSSQSVKERILSGTKRIYNNKSMFKEMGEQETLLDIMKRQNKLQYQDKKITTIPAALEKGGGMISVNAASSVRSKLNDAKTYTSVHGKDPKVKSRPKSAPSGRGKGNKSKGQNIDAQATKLMSTLQKLNPSVLF
jgi:hypothetical protein